MGNSRSYRLKAIRDGDVIYIGIIYADGSSNLIGAFAFPRDGQWREDVVFYDAILDAYKKRYSKIF